MSNGFSAADMSTAAANGHAEGYQAGYADAVKAVEAGSSPEADARTQIRNAIFNGVARTCDEVAPGIILSVAAQEAAGWQVFNSVLGSWQDASKSQYEGRKAHYPDEARELFAAPVAAAPVKCNVEGTWLWSKLMDWCKSQRIAPASQGGLFAIASEAHALNASTPAAPGIDLHAACTEAVYALARKLLWIAYVWNDHNFDHPYKIARALAQEFGIESFDQANAWLDEQAKLIDASPKGDDCETCNGRGIFDTNGNGPWDCYACGNKGNPKGAAPEFQVPAGWALVPDRMQLTPENMELLADTLRGADEDEPWCGGVLWIGQTTGDDGEPTYYGLNVGNVECLEEGSINIVEFAPLPQDSLKGDSDAPKYTTGHCENHKKPGGCPMHNLQCGYPQCDRRQATSAEVGA